MKSIIITIILGICLISLSSAQMYAGETIYFDLQDQIQNLQTVECEIINNNSNLEGLNLTVNNTGYTISTVVNFQPDNFTVLCLLNGYKIVNSNSGNSRSSNSGGSWMCYNNWSCSEWSKCLNNISTRECSKTAKGCFSKLTTKPIEIKSCLVELNNTNQGDIYKINLSEPDTPEESKYIFLNVLIICLVVFLIILVSVISYVKWKKQRKTNI